MVLNPDLTRTAFPPSSAVIRFVSLALLLMAMIALGAMAYFTQRSIAASRDRVVHAYLVRSALNDLQLAITRAEAPAASDIPAPARQPGAESREQFDLAQQRVDELSRLTVGDPGQQNLVGQLGQLITASAEQTTSANPAITGNCNSRSRNATGR